MSEILRRYFERRYHIPALESTTVEVLEALKEKTLPNERAMIAGLLEFCDFVKFAKHEPSIQEILLQNKNAIQIIDNTKSEDASSIVQSVPGPPSS